jgi:hypothetical protein
MVKDVMEIALHLNQPNKVRKYQREMEAIAGHNTLADAEMLGEAPARNEPGQPTQYVNVKTDSFLL